MEKEYIQLPALKRDLDPDVVKALWAFIQLPEKYQARYQEQYELLNQRKEEADRQLQENIQKIDADAIHLYEETMRSMIRDIVQQSCNLACWVRYHKYDLKESLEEMIDQQPHAAKYIIAMNILMDDAEGSDVGAKAEIYRLILELAKKGKTVLINTLEIPGIQKVADCCAVFYEGSIVKILEHKEIDEMTIMMYSTNAVQVEEETEHE